SNQKNPIKTKDTNKLASKKQNHTLNGKKSMAKKQQTKTTKHTIEFSNNRLFLLCHPVLGQPHQLNLKLAGKSNCFFLAYFIRSEATSPA
ncbi:hypothetical protein, partial [Mycolicibacterium alvei]|uniref:hypothetical protein n=2 Tax=Mycolicibacterium alvei TaxID=67081 RepID=UPI0021F267E9